MRGRRWDVLPAALPAADYAALGALERAGAGWVRPRDIGGTSASGLSDALARLVRLGLVEARRREPFRPQRRPTLLYRVTERGRAYLAAPVPGPHDRPDCPCGHPIGTRGPCAGCNCDDPTP